MVTVSIDAAVIAVPPDIMLVVATAILGAVIALLIWWLATRRRATAEEQATADRQGTQAECPASESSRGAEPAQMGTEAENGSNGTEDPEQR